jgi:hypothetical protein
MDMLRHHHIAKHEEVIPFPNPLQGAFKKTANVGKAKVRPPAIATEGNKMEVPRILITNQPLSHDGILMPVSKKQDKGHPIYAWSPAKNLCAT